jgi:hypothetical protein
MSLAQEKARKKTRSQVAKRFYLKIYSNFNGLRIDSLFSGIWSDVANFAPVIKNWGKKTQCKSNGDGKSPIM